MSRAFYNLSLLCCMGLSGCALNERMLEFMSRKTDIESQLHSQHEEFARAIADPDVRRRAQKIDRPWIAGKAQPLERELTLPPALQTNVMTTLLFSDGPLELPEIAERITAITRIPVHVSPDALLLRDAFMPRLASSSDIKKTKDDPDRVYLSGNAEPLARILDRIGAGLGVSWSYRGGRIEFYRTATRVFGIHALTLDAKAEASLGQQGATSSDAGFNSTSRTHLSSSDSSLFDVVRARIEPFLTRSGVLVAQPGASASIVVTDTPQVLENIAAYIDYENKILTRRVRL